MNSTNTVVANAMAARNAAPKGLARNRDLTEAKEEKLEKEFSVKIDKFFSLLNEVSPKLRMLYAVANSAALILKSLPSMYDGDSADFYKVEKAVDNLEKVAEWIEMRL